MTPRRELATAIASCLLGAAVVLVAAGRPWTSLTLSQGALLPPLQLAPAGRALDPAAGALGLVGLAGVVALAATRRRGRLVVGALLGLAGGGVAVTSVRTGLGLRAAVERSGLLERVTGATPPLPGSMSATAWPWLSAAGGVLLVLAGILVISRGPAWAALSARYETPARRPEPGEASLWEALDRGEDPTR